jgi:biotin operon repressor
MTKAERDRLVALKKAKKKLITQREAAEELRLSVRHVKRLIHALKKRGIEARKETVRQWMLRAKLWLGEKGQGPRRSYMAAAAEPVRGADAVGHERPRLAGGAWRAAVSDRDDRRRHRRKGKVRPITGKRSARPAGKPGDVFALEHLRRSLPRH